jgi:hypothetical protein
VQSSNYDYDLVGALSYFRAIGKEGIWFPVVNHDLTDEGAKQRAIASIDPTPYAFGEDLLEIRETLRFLRNPADSLFHLSKSFRRTFNQLKRQRKLSSKNVKHYGDLFQALSDVWLQYRFAASPLIRSSIDVLEAYSEKSKAINHPPRRTARGFENFTFSESVEQSYDGMYFDTTRDVNASYKASILYTVTNPVYDWKYRLGLRTKDVPTTIWQIMPYSFMVDRLLDITSFSKGVINLGDPNVKILAGSVTYKSEDKKTYRHSDHVQAGWSMSINGELQEIKDFSYIRTTWQPSVYDTIPGFTPGKVVDSATKIADLITLSYGNFTRF